MTATKFSKPRPDISFVFSNTSFAASSVKTMSFNFLYPAGLSLLSFSIALPSFVPEVTVSSKTGRKIFATSSSTLAKAPNERATSLDRASVNTLLAPLATSLSSLSIANALIARLSCGILVDTCATDAPSGSLSNSVLNLFPNVDCFKSEGSASYAALASPPVSNKSDCVFRSPLT